MRVTPVEVDGIAAEIVFDLLLLTFFVADFDVLTIGAFELVFDDLDDVILIAVRLTTFARTRAFF